MRKTSLPPAKATWRKIQAIKFQCKTGRPEPEVTAAVTGGGGESMRRVHV